MTIINILQLTRPTGDETASSLTDLKFVRLQLTRPTGDETLPSTSFTRYFTIATHTPHRGRNFILILKIIKNEFIATHTPHRGRNSIMSSSERSSTNCNSHAPQGTKSRSPSLFLSCSTIATHTPHRGRNSSPPILRQSAAIATHTPHRGRNCVKCSI